MDFAGGLWWVVASLIGLAWRVVWFLLGGWVATLAQLGIIVAVIFGYKYGWRQALPELASRGTTFGRFVWAWVRAKEPPPRTAASAADRTAAIPRGGRRRQPGDVQINVSTLLSVLMLAGLGLAATLR